MDRDLDWRTGSPLYDKPSVNPELLANLAPESRPVVYFVAASNGLIKIGFARDIDERFGKLACASPLPLELLATTPGGRVEERRHHERFRHLRKHGEWFEDTPELREYIERVASISAPLGRQCKEEGNDGR